MGVKINGLELTATSDGDTDGFPHMSDLSIAETNRRLTAFLRRRGLDEGQRFNSQPGKRRRRLGKATKGGEPANG